MSDKKFSNAIKLAPQPGKQRELMDSVEQYVYYGGARAGGKTHGMCLDLVMHQIKKVNWTYKNRKNLDLYEHIINHKDYEAIVIRKTKSSLGAILKIQNKMYPQLGGKFDQSNYTWNFPSGAKIVLASLHDKNAFEKYIGQNYTYMWIDEANQFGWEVVQKLFGSVRSTDKRLPALIRVTSNPGGKGHVWLKQKFYDRCKPIEKPQIYRKEWDIYERVYETGKPYVDINSKSNTKEEWKYIPATVFDNKILIENDPSYIEKLKTYAYVQREMWLYGNHEIVAGQYFDEFDSSIHEIEYNNFRFGSDEEIRKGQAHWNLNTHYLYAGVDYGISNPSVYALVAVNKQDRDDCVLVECLKQVKLDASTQAININKMLKENYNIDSTQVMMTSADPSMWNNTTSPTGLYSPANYYFDEGVILTSANNSRINGWHALKYMLRSNKNSNKPRLRIRSNCVYALETIPALIYNETEGSKGYLEDIEKGQDDHLADALRYWAMSFRSQFTKKKHKKLTWQEKYLKYNNNEYTGKQSWLIA